MVFSNPPKGSLTLSSPTSPVPEKGSPLISYSAWPMISGCWDLSNQLPSEYLTLSTKSCRDTSLPQGCCFCGNCNTTGSWTCWVYHPYPKLSKLNWNWWSSCQGTQADGPQTSHAEEGDVIQPSVQVPTCFTKETTPGSALCYRGLLHFAQENLTLLHLPADTCQNSHSPLPHILNTELSHLWVTRLFVLCSCVVSLISKTIQVLQLQMTTVITVSNSAAIS